MAYGRWWCIIMLLILWNIKNNSKKWNLNTKFEWRPRNKYHTVSWQHNSKNKQKKPYTEDWHRYSLSSTSFIFVEKKKRSYFMEKKKSGFSAKIRCTWILSCKSLTGFYECHAIMSSSLKHMFKTHSLFPFVNFWEILNKYSNSNIFRIHCEFSMSATFPFTLV